MLTAWATRMLLYLKTPETPVTPPDIVAKTWKVLKLETTQAAFNYSPFGYGYQHTAFRSASINETGSVTALSVYPTKGLALRNAAGVMTYIPLDYSV